MDKSQALHNFWSSFGIPAYDSRSVPTGEDKPEMPYITYDVAIGSVEQILFISADVWYRSTRWDAISKKVDEIAEKLGKKGFYRMDIDGGHLWLTMGSPFAQRMDDPDDDTIRRYYLQVDAEFLTAY